ncbi:MAG TPA: Xaa-Pro peptidase family protein [Candidatus Limnocylindria bacterium]|nr:Xaa-Pro peptidase family protein [Candidatus Limnocylindria bacterium]
MAEPDRYPTFSDAEFTLRRGAVRERMAAAELRGIVVYGAGRTAEVQYLAGWPGSRESFLLFPLEGEPCLLVQLYNHVPNARRTAVLADVRWAGEPGLRALDTVAATLAELGLDRGRIGIVGPLPWTSARRFAERLPAVAWAEFGAIRELRMIKSAEELVRYREAARLTDLAMVALERETRPGLREYELGAIVEHAIGRAGGQPGIHFMATTPMREPRVGVPGQILSSRVLEKGDVLITEITADYWGYGGQIHRSYAIGEEPTEAYRRLHDACVEAYRRILAVLRDGATVGDALDAAEVIHERGYTIYDDLLHGAAQLPPIFQTRRTARGRIDEAFTFREDMVVTLQPNVITPDERMGMQIGETLRITRTGTERLHDFPMRFIVTGG